MTAAGLKENLRCQRGVTNRRRPGWTPTNHRKDLLKERDDADMTANGVRGGVRRSAYTCEAPPHWLACMELVEDVLCVVSLVLHSSPCRPTPSSATPTPRRPPSRDRCQIGTEALAGAKGPLRLPISIAINTRSRRYCRTPLLDR
ncbi:hypothetical protein Pcinc_035151 [Petrolisthes cinctipes]|uniref:Uncharacterized protein n=1 Tax=Petrolisthes cinctipes TaxID=88211 RepID=A0AAE1EP00_PETCI|nr:hypothetical protein Pcinc_035151 [Petrolisthes cinctipes]